MSIDGSIIFLPRDKTASIMLVRCFSLRLFIISAVIFIAVRVIYTISIPEKCSGITTRNGESVDRALFNHKPATSKS